MSNIPKRKSLTQYTTRNRGSLLSMQTSRGHRDDQLDDDIESTPLSEDELLASPKKQPLQGWRAPLAPPKRGRGRPRKDQSRPAAAPQPPAVKRGPGRPRKIQPATGIGSLKLTKAQSTTVDDGLDSADDSDFEDTEDSEAAPSPVKRGPGRPRKVQLVTKFARTKAKSPTALDGSRATDDSDFEDVEDSETEQVDEEDASAAQKEADDIMDALGDGPPEATAPLTGLILQVPGSDRHEYATALDDGYHVLVNRLWEIELPLRQVLEGTPLQMFDRVVTIVVATIPNCILREVMAGNLAHAHLQERKPDIVEVVKTYNDPWVLDNVPCVYQISFAGHTGESPMALQWERLCRGWEIYLDFASKDPSRITFAQSVDAVGHKQYDPLRAKYGARRYAPPVSEDTWAPNMLESEKVRYKHLEPSAEKVQRIRDFLTAVRLRIASAQPNDRLNITYTGYTVKASERWKHHSNNPTNYIMGGTRAIAKVILAPFDFDLRPYVIAPLASEEEAPIAEVVVCALSNGYFKSGYGFNMADAGESNDSIMKLEPKQKIKVWAWILKFSPRKANMKEHNKILAAQAEKERQKELEMRERLKFLDAELEKRARKTQEDRQSILAMKARTAELGAQHNWQRLARNEILISKAKVENEIYEEELDRLQRLQDLLMEAKKTSG